MPEISIVVATKADAEVIAAISRETFFDTYAAENTKENMDKFLAEQFSTQMLMDEVGADENYFLLAYIETQLVGYIKIKSSTHPELLSDSVLEIARLYTRVAFIGKGVGRALMQAAIDFAKLHEKKWLWLIVWKQNQRAIQFYQSFGYFIFAESTFLLGDDLQNDWVMCKNI